MIDYMVQIMILTVSWHTNGGRGVGELVITKSRRKIQNERNGNRITDDASKVAVTAVFGIPFILICSGLYSPPHTHWYDSWLAVSYNLQNIQKPSTLNLVEKM